MDMAYSTTRFFTTAVRRDVQRVYGEYRQEYWTRRTGMRTGWTPLPTSASSRYDVYSAGDDNTRRFGDKVLRRPPTGKYGVVEAKAKIDDVLARDMIVVSKNDVPQYKKIYEARAAPVGSSICS